MKGHHETDVGGSQEELNHEGGRGGLSESWKGAPSKQ